MHPRRVPPRPLPRSHAVRTSGDHPAPAPVRLGSRALCLAPASSRRCRCGPRRHTDRGDGPAKDVGIAARGGTSRHASTLGSQRSRRVVSRPAAPGIQQARSTGPRAPSADRRLGALVGRVRPGRLERGVPRRVGRTKGDLNSKLHAVCDGQGQPVVLLLWEGQMSDHKGAALMLGTRRPSRRAGSVSRRTSSSQAGTRARRLRGRLWTRLHRHALISCIAFAYLQHLRLQAAARGTKEPDPPAPRIRRFLKFAAPSSPD